MPLRRAADLVGRALVAFGVLVLLFAAHQLWATNLTEARAQDALREEFRDALSALEAPAPAAGATGAAASPSTSAAPAAPAAPTAPVATTPPTTAPPTTAPPSPAPTATPAPPATTAPAAPAVRLDAPPPAGEPVALLRIPAIDLEKVVVEGVAPAHLKAGPGRYPGTALPGRPGNAAIAGHRTTYGAPFADLGRLAPGDDVLVTTVEGEFRYEVVGSRVVRPDEVEVLESVGDDRLTLTTCHPRFSARQRLVVVAALVGPAAGTAPPAREAAAAAPPAGSASPPTTVAPGAGGPTDAGSASSQDASGDGPAPDDGTSTPTTAARGTGGATSAADGGEADTADLGGATAGERDALVPALAWGALAGATWVGTRTASRRWRRWPPWLIGLPVLAVALFLLFEQVARLLPSSV